MNKPIEDYVSAIGALSETCGLMFNQLKKQGFTRNEALRLVEAYVTTTLQPKNFKED